MNKKTLIEIVVVVLGFIGTAYVLYTGLFSGGASAPTPTTSPITAQNILPYGDTFDYQKIDDLKNQNFQFGAVPYPVLNAGTEVGKASLSDLMKNTASSPATPGK